MGTGNGQLRVTWLSRCHTKAPAYGLNFMLCQSVMSTAESVSD